MRVQYGLSAKYLPAHPHPFPEELFTHWFMRLAHANYLKSQSLADLAFSNPSSFWARDQDKLAADPTLERLSSLTGQTTHSLRSHTLQNFEGMIYEKHNPLGNTKWILPLGIYHRTRRGWGLQYCPNCLATDTTPYFRLSWRLAFYTLCERHVVRMHDCCFHCGAPITYFRKELGIRSSHNFELNPVCHVCHFPLTDAPALDPCNGEIEILIQLRSLMMFYPLGWSFYTTQPQNYLLLYLDVVHRLCNFLLSARGMALLNMALHEGDIAMPCQTWTYHDIEKCRVEVRHAVMWCVMWLLSDWPDRFLMACRRTRITQSRILTDWHGPFWFLSVIKSGLSHHPDGAIALGGGR